METAVRMGRFGVLALLLVVVRVAGESLPLPSFLKACYRDDPKLNECATANAIPAIPQLKNGLPEYGIPPLDPLFIKKIKIDQKRPEFGFDMEDVELHGLSQSKVKSIRMDTNPLTFTWSLIVPNTVFLGKYEADGKILLLPISGKGDINITLVDLEYTYKVNFDVKKKGGEEYLVPKANSIQYNVKRIYFNLENLFNGNKVLGDTMNEFLNENWREIDQTFGEKFAAEVAAAVKTIIDGLTKSVSYDRLLPKKA